MTKYLILLVFLYTFNCSAQTNTNISNFTYWDTEPSIAVNPVDSNNLVAAWMRAGGVGILSAAISYSTNAGASWSIPALIPHLHSNFTAADVSLAFNNSGTVFLSYIDHSAVYDSGYVMVAKSVNGGAAWSPGVKVISALETPDIPIDRPWIAVDRSSGPYSGRLYVVTKSISEGTLPHHIWMKSSADNGATWSSRKLVDDSIPSNLVTNAMGVPAVGADGSLYIGYVSYNPPQSVYARVICLKSTDGGNSLIPHIIGNAAVNSAVTDTLYQGSYVLSANPMNAGNLVYTFTDNRNGDPDILSVYSNDGGITWSNPPIRINDDALSNGTGQDMCWAAFSQTGKYAAAWRDRRNTGGTSSSPFEIFATVSSNGGASFSTNYKISSAPSPFINIQKGNDFIGVCLNDNYLCTDWCDLRTGNTEIFSGKTYLGLLTGIGGDSKSDDLSLIVFPNPSKDNVSVMFQLKQRQFLQITLCDIQGRIIKKIASQIFTEGSQHLQIDISELSSGSYLLQMQTENKNSAGSAILQVER